MKKGKKWKVLHFSLEKADEIYFLNQSCQFRLLFYSEIPNSYPKLRIVIFSLFNRQFATTESQNSYFRISIMNFEILINKGGQKSNPVPKRYTDHG